MCIRDRYVYASLGYPELTIIGEVYNKVSKEASFPDWINQRGIKSQEIEKHGLGFKVLFRGPCDLSSTCLLYTSIKTTKQVFVHRIASFLLNQSDQILIFAFASLKMVAYYGNYTLIATKIAQVFSTAIDSIGAGVGNLVAEGNKQRIIYVFWDLMAVRFCIAGILVFGLYFTIEPFIVLWLGEQFLLDKIVLILLLVTILIGQIRGPVDIYISAYGMYADTWAPITEAIINVTVTFIAAYYFCLLYTSQ